MHKLPARSVLVQLLLPVNPSSYPPPHPTRSYHGRYRHRNGFLLTNWDIVSQLSIRRHSAYFRPSWRGRTRASWILQHKDQSTQRDLKPGYCPGSIAQRSQSWTHWHLIPGCVGACVPEPVEEEREMHPKVYLISFKSRRRAAP